MAQDDGRVLGNTKQLLDDRVHQMMAEDSETAPPSYDNIEPGGITFSAKNLTGAFSFNLLFAISSFWTKKL